MRMPKGMSNGQIGCYDGTSLYWSYFDNEEMARSSFEGYAPQIKKQMKKFSQEAVTLFVCDKAVSAYKLTYTSLQGYEMTEVIFGGTVNGHPIFGQLRLQKKINTSAELSPLFQQIVKF